MHTEILLYQGIHSFTAERFVMEMNEAIKDEVLVRLNTEGGDPSDLFAIVTKMSEHQSTVNVTVDGKAHSSGLFLLCYAKHRECNDVSTFVFHRASWGEWFEHSSLMTDAHREIMDNVNASLRTAVENTIDEAVLEKITGHTLDEIFDTENRLDVTFNASEAKKIGFIDKIVKITPEITASMASAALKMAANFSSEIPTEFPKPAPKPVLSTQTKQKKITKNNMETLTIEELQAKYPAMYAEVVKVGVTKEANRTKAFMAFFEIDAKAVKEKIDSGEEFDVSFSAEMSAASIGKLQAGNAESESDDLTETEKIAASIETAKKEKLAAGVESVKENLGIKTK